MFESLNAMPAPLPESILDGFPCPVLKIDRQFRLLYRNPAAVRLNAPTPQTAAASHCYEWINLTQPCPDCPVARAFESGQVERITKCRLSSDYRLVSFEQTAIPVRAANGEIAYVLEVDLDTTPLLTLRQDSEANFVQTIFAFAGLIEKRDGHTGRHSVSTRTIALQLGRVLGLDTAQLDDLSTTALLHDIGKIGTPETVLCKRGRLSAAERREIERHPLIGHDVLCKVDRFRHVAEYVLNHHERLDGSGYPFGRSGRDIPWLARILSVADVFEALTADRVYRPALPVAEALRIIRAGRGSQFDSDVVDSLLQLSREGAWDGLGRRGEASSPDAL